MPNFDGTGPAGAGAMTGRGDGSCATPQGGRRVFNGRGGCGRGFGQGFGRGMGVRNGAGQGFCFRQTSLEEQEKMLEEELAVVREEKKNANKKD